MNLIKRLYYGIGAAVFIFSLYQFLTTVQPSVSFWDCGEFIAASYYLQVPHPPGAPFFLILGRLFSMLPFDANIGFKVNLVSVFSSAFSVLFLYLVAVKLIENFRGKEYKSIFEALIVYLSAAIGALSFSLSDTFWFNGVEAEVYAASTLLFSIVVYLLLRWNERYQNQDAEKYIILMFYLIGLSIGVHLMAVLAIVPMMMLIVSKRYALDEEFYKKSAYLFLINSILILLLAVILWGAETNPQPPMPEEYKAFDQKAVIIFAGATLIFAFINRKYIFSYNSFYFPILVGGIALAIVYPGVVKRLPWLVASLGGNNIYLDIIIIAAILSILAYLIYWSSKNQKEILRLFSISLLFVVLGFTTYAMTIIRSNQNPPMNENEPNDFTELVSYLNREQYGDFPTFKRRFSQEPHQQEIYTNYASDLEFWWRYQMHHMFNRYLFWNYIGRKSWEQDAPEDWSKLFGIPFILGLIGVFYHFRKDWKMASVFLVMFIFMGYLTAFYQNQQEPQPRERDYFYVGAFFVFSIWIALGVKGLIYMIVEDFNLQKYFKPISIAVLTFAALFVPIRMAQVNWFEHDRSKNWFPWDYAYNILQSCQPDAILFTYGDNDTFPLWYLQDVEGVRRDVRVVNLSLLNTSWYIKQMKNFNHYGSKPIKMTLSDLQIDRISVSRYPKKSEQWPVPKEIFEKFGVKDESIINRGFIEINLQGQIDRKNEYIFMPNDIAARDIILSNLWERPIYYSITVGPRNRLGLDPYLRQEGFALLLTPIKWDKNTPFIDANLMREYLFGDLKGGYSKDYKPIFRFTGLQDTTIFFDDTHVNYAQNYRGAFLQLALHYQYNENDPKKAAEVIDRMFELIPLYNFPMDYGLLSNVAEFYISAGRSEDYVKYAKIIEKQAWNEINTSKSKASLARRNQYRNPYMVLLQVYQNLNDMNNYYRVLLDLSSIYPNDESLRQEINRVKGLLDKK